MKKIMMKFSDERSREFCIKTCVVENEQTKEKIVIKQNIFSEGKKHINQMLRNKSLLEAAYPHVKICPVSMEREGLIKFPFISGVSLGDKYRACISENNISEAEKLLQEHRKLIIGGENNRCRFKKSAQFIQVFGDDNWGEDIPALGTANLDSTAENIIYQKDTPIFIDYEWVFDFPIPEDLVIYYNIRDMYHHIREFEEFYPLKKAIEFLEIELSESKMEKAIKHFFNYVYIDKNGAGYGLSKFMNEKGIKTVSDIQKSEEETRIGWEKCSQELLEKTAILNVFEKNWREASQANALSNQRIQRLQSEVNQLQAQAAEQQQAIETWRQAYESVVNSRTWRIAKKLKRVLGKK